YGVPWAFSPDGRHLVSFRGDVKSLTGELKIWNISSGKETLSIKGDFPREYPFPAVFSPDGGCIAMAFRNGTLKVLDTLTGEEIYSVESCLQSCWSSEGNCFATASLGGPIKVWDVTSTSENLKPKKLSPRSIIRGSSTSRIFTLSPDGQRLASLDGD